MLIVDAQVHVWAEGTPNTGHRKISAFSKDDLLAEMDEAGINAALIHPPTWDPNSNQIARYATQRHPDRFGMLGNFALDRPDIRSLVDNWKQHPGILGFRFTFIHPEHQAWLTDGTIDWLWPAAERVKLPLALWAAYSLTEVGRIAERHPGLRLIIDHMARPQGVKDDKAWANLPSLLALAKYPNVAVKATGAPAYSSFPYPFRNIHDSLHRICDAFGPERVFWGSDITRMPCSWRQCVTLFTEELPWLSEKDKELIMGLALCKWLNWKLPG